MEARNVATTFRRSEETYIDDTPRCHQVRRENARKVAEDNTGPTSFSLGQKKCETCEAMWSNLKWVMSCRIFPFPNSPGGSGSFPSSRWAGFLRKGLDKNPWTKRNKEKKTCEKTSFKDLKFTIFGASSMFQTFVTWKWLEARTTHSMRSKGELLGSRTGPLFCGP